jgi:polysaccharide export outer membrane protein
MKQSLSLAIVSAFTLLFNACNWSSEQGPVSMHSIQKAQKRGSVPTDEYRIIDITSHNINDYNKAPLLSNNVLPKVDLRRTYSDAIRPYDQLILQVVDAGSDSGITSQDKLPAQFGPIEVPQTGRISIPYAGDFNVLGKEIADVQKEIQEAYTPVFNTARVSLNRSSRMPLTANVIGIANAPGQQTIDRKGVTLADLIAKSGGTSQEPFTCEYVLHRGPQSYKLNNSDVTTKNILAQHSDILEIRKSSDRSITLLGAVNRPGSYPFPNYSSQLDDFIGAGSGFRSDSANLSGVFVFRKTEANTTDIYRFDLRDPAGVIASSSFSVHGNDIIYVTEAPLTRWNRTIRNILPFSQVNNFSQLGNY